MGKIPSLELYRDSHLKWNFSGRQWRSSAEDVFEISYGRCLRPALDFRSECVRAVKDLARISTLPLGVLFSGGVDSEIICRSFKNAGIPFRALVFRFEGGWNDHDVTYAFSLCKRYGWPVEIFDFDIVRWLEKDMLPLVEEYAIIHPEIATHMRMMEMAADRGYFPIDGRGDISLIHTSEGVVWYESEESLMPTKFMLEKGLEGCPRFFKFSPELIYSWLTDPMMRRWVRYRVPLRMKESLDFKIMIHTSYWEDLEPREKFTGFEKLLRLYRIQRDRLVKRGFDPAVRTMKYDEVVAQMAHREVRLYEI